MRIHITLTLAALASCVIASCDNSGIQPKAGPELSVDPSELLIGLPSEGNYRESSIRLTNTGGTNVIITSLTLQEDDDSRELSLLDAEDWSGRVTIEPNISLEVRVGWRVLDAQPDTGSITIIANTGEVTILELP